MYRHCSVTRAWLIIGALALALVGPSVDVSKCAAQSSESTDSQVDVNLRAAWSADQDRYWQIRVAVVADDDETGSSALSKIINRCDSIAATGAFQIATDGKAVTFTPRGSLSEGEFDFRFQGPATARLSVQVVGNPHFNRLPESPADPAWDGIASHLIPLDDLVRGEKVQESTDTDQSERPPATWSVVRTKDDQIRIEGLTPAGFAEVSDTFSFSVHANSLTDWAGQDLTLVYSLRQASTGKVVAEKRWPVNIDPNGNTVSVDIDEPAPAVAGVYEIHCRLEKGDDHLLMRLRRRPAVVATTAVPIVVTVPALAGLNAPSAQPWQRVGRIQPAKDSEWELNQWLPNSSKRLIRRIDPRESAGMKRSRHAGESVSVLAPGESYVATLPARQAGYPHKITIRYPAGLQTRLRVEVDDSQEFRQPSRRFLLADEQYRRERQTWRSHTFLHYPSPRDEFIRLTNQAEETDAEFATITVDSGGAALATATANAGPDSRIAALNISGLTWVEKLTSDIAGSKSQRQLHPDTRALHRFVTAAERIINYAATAGLNAVVVAACEGDQIWFESEGLFPNRKASRFSGQYLESLMRLADARSMRVFVRVDLSAQLCQVESAILADQEQRGVLRRIDESKIRYNTQHPVVQQSIAAFLDKLHQQLQPHDSYAGLALNCSGDTHLRPISQRHLDVATVKSFANSVGKQDLTQSQLFAWLQDEGREPLRSWLRERSQQVYQSLSENIDRDVFLIGSQLGSIASSAETNLANVIDLRRYASDSLENEYTTSFRPAGRQAVKRTYAVLLGRRGNDSAYKSSFMRLESAKDLTDVLVGLDPQMLMIDDSELTLGLSSSTYEMLTGFSSLPSSPLEEIAGVDSAARTVRVRYLAEDNNVFLVVNNLAPWSSDVQLDLASHLEWRNAAPAGSGADARTEQQNSWEIDRRRLDASLAPGGMIVLTANWRSATTTRLPVRAWSSRVSGGGRAMRNIKDKVTAVVERIGALSDPDPYEHLSNGGFEKSGGVGIPGWMHTQHPQGAVRIDDHEALVGNQSVLLKNDQRNSSRAWLVSEIIKTPSSGRLAVSLACRAELAGGDTKHRLRVSIEGIRSGQPFRETEEFEIPRDGQWQPRKVVLEAEALDPSEVNSVRLTIDSLSSGRVWIDDIHLHDWFPTTSERGELEGEAFLAVQGLQRGSVTPAARLLHNYWAQYLINQKQTRQLAPVMQTTEQQQELPGMAERIRSWLPRPLRF